MLTQLKLDVELFVKWNKIKLEIMLLAETEIELKLKLFSLK